MVNVVGMMRVKNCARWIVESIRSILPLCRCVYVLNDHSTDGTAFEIINTVRPTWVNQVRYICSPFRGLDEARDKNFLLGTILNEFPRADWVLNIDGDEVLEDGGCDTLRQFVEAPNNPTPAYGLKIAHLWNSPTTVRTDGRWGNQHRASLYRLDAAWQGYGQTTFGSGANFHCGNMPRGIRPVENLEIKLIHYGYMEEADRIKRHTFYKEHDPHNRFTENYEDILRGTGGGPIVVEELK